MPTSSSFLKIPSITFSLPLNSSSGRGPSEVPERLRDGLLAGGISAENIGVVLPEEDAVKTALDMARPDNGLGLAYHIPRMIAQPIIVWWALWVGGVTDWPFRRRHV